MADITILLIDDNQGFVDNMQDLCEIKQWVFRSANTARAGVELAIACCPSIVICDLKMNGNGYNVWTEIQRNPATANIPFLFVTAAVSEETLRIMHALGIPYLTKPFSLDTLTTSIQKMIH